MHGVNSGTQPYGHCYTAIQTDGSVSKHAGTVPSPDTPRTNEKLPPQFPLPSPHTPSVQWPTASSAVACLLVSLSDEVVTDRALKK